MGLTAFVIQGLIKLDDKDFKKSLSDAEGSAKSWGEKVSGVGSKIATGLKAAAVATGAAAAAVGKVAMSAVNAYSEYEQLTGGVETLFGTSAKNLKEYFKQTGITSKSSQEEVAASMKKYNMLVEAEKNVIDNAHKAYLTAGVDANTYMQTVTSFSASLLQGLGGDTVKAAQIADMAMIDMSDNANKMGTDMASIQNAYQGFAKQNYTMLDNLKLGYGGTKKEMERLLKDAEKIMKKNGQNVKYSINNLSDVYEAIHVVQEEMGITGTTAEEARTTIQGSTKMMQAAWMNLKIAMVSPDGNIGQAITDMVESVKVAAKNWIPAIKQALSGIGEVFKEIAPIIGEELPGMLNDLLPGLIEGATSLISSLAEALPGLISTIVPILVETLPGLITQVIPALAEGAVTLVTALAQAFIDNIGVLADAVVQIIDNLANKFKESDSPLLQMFAGILDGVKVAFQWFIDNKEIVVAAIGAILAAFVVSQVASFVASLNPLTIILTAIAAIATLIITNWEPISEFFTNLWNDITQAASMAWETISNALSTAWDTISTTAETVWNALGDFFSNLWKTISGAVKTAWNAISDFFSNLWKTISGAVETAWNAISDFFSNLWKTISGAVETAWNAIKDFFSNLWNTISGAVETAWNAIAGFFSGLWETISTVLTTAWNAIEGFLSGLWEGIKETATTIWNTLKDNVTTAINILRRSLETIWNAITSWLGTTWENLKTTATNVWNALKDAVTTAINVLRRSLETIWTAITSWLSTTWETIKTTASNIWYGIKDTIHTAINIARLTIENIWNGLVTFLSGIWEGIKTTASDLWNGIKDTILNAIRSAKTSLSVIWETIKLKAEQAWEAVSNAIKPWIDGIVQVINGVIGVVEDVLKWFGLLEDKDGQNLSSTTSEHTHTNTIINKVINEGSSGGHGFAKGDWTVPYDNFPAILHRNEMVLTASQARRYRDGEGGDVNYSALSSAIVGAIRQGLEGAQVNSYLDGKAVTDEVSRILGDDLSARRFA